MKNEKILLGIVLFILGFTGVLSILTMEISLPEEVMKLLLEKFSPKQIKLLILINPTIMLIGAVILGVFLHDKVSLDAPVIKNIIRYKKSPQISSILKYGIIGGVISGIILSLIGLIFYPILPQEFLELGEKLKPTLAARFLYGGFTEEIIIRFGLMTFIVWLISKIFRSTNSKIYWISILIVSVIFGLGHFPIVFQSLSNPSALLLSYVLIGNSIGGIIFGWLYWKKGLETAFIAHIFAHIILVLLEPLLKLA
ncbi:MAG: CPBP family intramembrane metalloprotease [Bacteroidales bacterium]|nr:CPBP family intramembrane metalloprotease [Bacteroidales bacterium]